MQSGRFKEYSWKDIEQLIFADAGLPSNEVQKTNGEQWCVNGFSPPSVRGSICISIKVFDVQYSERIKEQSKT